MKLCLALASLSLSCAAPNVPGALDITAYDAEQLACVGSADAAAQADTCRAHSRARFCMRFPTMPNCTEGGAP
jgi:hypothetical protein